MANITTTKTNLRKGIFKNIRTALYNQITGVGTRVYGSFPVKKITLPLIVIENAQKNEPNKTLTTNAEENATVLITVYDKMAEKVDTYADAIDARIENQRSVLEGYGITFDDVIDNDNVSFTDEDGRRIHSKTLSLPIYI